MSNTLKTVYSILEYLDESILQNKHKRGGGGDVKCRIGRKLEESGKQVKQR